MENVNAIAELAIATDLFISLDKVTYWFIVELL